MADYRLPDNALTLVLDEPPYAGAEIEVRLGVGLGVYARARTWLGRFRDAEAGGDEEQAAIEAVYSLFVDEALLAWNLIDHRGPVPPTTEGMLRLPLLLGLEIVSTWLAALMAVPVPLGSDSPAGEPPTRLPASRLGRPKSGTSSGSTGDSSRSASRHRSRMPKTRNVS